MNDYCQWVKVFDHNFNISCVGETGKRANGNFKGKDIGARWEFLYCPYCGKPIELIENTFDEE